MKFRTLKMLSELYALLGMLVFGLGILFVIAEFAMPPINLMSSLVACIIGVILFSTGELITLLISIEDNTRRSASAMETLVNRRKKPQVQKQGDQ